MPNYCRVVLIGHMTRDAEVKAVGDTSVAGFSIAYNRKWKSKGGEKKEKVAFIDCKAWGLTGDNIAKWVKKGDPILVEGILDQENWEAKDGGKRSRLIVQVDRFEFMGGKKSGGGGDDTDARAVAAARGDSGPPASNEDECPF